MDGIEGCFRAESYALSKLVDLYLGNYYSSHDSVKPANGSTLRDVKATACENRNE